MSVSLRQPPSASAVLGTELATGLRIQRNSLLIVLGLGVTLSILMLVAIGQVPPSAAAEGGARMELDLHPPIGLLLFLGLLMPLIAWSKDPVHARGYMLAQPVDRRVTTGIRVLAGWIGLLLLIAAAAVGVVILTAIAQPMVRDRTQVELSTTVLPHAAAIVGPTVLYLLSTCLAVLFRRPAIVLIAVVIGVNVVTGIGSTFLVHGGETILRATLVFFTSMMMSFSLAITGSGVPLGQSFLGLPLTPDNWALFAAGWLLASLAAAGVSIWVYREVAR